MRTIMIKIGSALLIITLLMLIPVLTTIIYNEDDFIFLTSAILTLLFSITLLILGKPEKLLPQQVVIITTMSWIMATIFSSLPFYISGFSFTDAFFEAMSGITTTGATILTNIEEQKKSILMWRAILHGIGGIGIMITGIVIMPLFKGINNAKLFHAESSEMSTLGSTKKISTHITLVYLFILLCCITLYKIAGMNFFDAICHGISTVSTGGFANYSDSFTHYTSYFINYIAIIFMISGSIPFLLYIRLIKGDFAILSDEQVRWLFKIILIFSIPVMIDAKATMNLHTTENVLINSFNLALFNTTSLLTSTGFIKGDYTFWNIGVTSVVLFCLAFCGGCSGSTTGGIKIFRIIILIKHSLYSIRQVLSPNKIEVIQINKCKLDMKEINSAYSFFFIFITVHFLSAIPLAFSGLNFTTSISATAAAITNSGPGIGNIIGPYGNYATLTNLSKFILSFLMILGRLEVLTVMAFTILLLKK